jgi:hypothetical protein
MAITALAKHGRVDLHRVRALGQVHENAVGAERHVGVTLQVLLRKPRRDYEEPGERGARTPRSRPMVSVPLPST